MDNYFVRGRAPLTQDDDGQPDAVDEDDCEGVEPIRWVTSRNQNYLLCVVHAKAVPDGVLQAAKGIASTILNLSDGLDKHIIDLPRDLDGGWPELEHHGGFLTYAQIQSGHFRGVSAVAVGSPKVRRERALAVALICSAATENKEISDDALSRWCPAMLDWVNQAKQLCTQLWTAHGGGEEEDGMGDVADMGAEDSVPPRNRPLASPSTPQRNLSRAPRFPVRRRGTLGNMSGPAEDAVSEGLRQEVQQYQEELAQCEQEAQLYTDEATVAEETIAALKRDKDVAGRQRRNAEQKAREAQQKVRDLTEEFAKTEAQLRAELEQAQRQLQAKPSMPQDSSVQEAILRTELLCAEEEEQEAKARHVRLAGRVAALRKSLKAHTGVKAEEEAVDDQDDPLMRATERAVAVGAAAKGP